MYNLIFTGSAVRAGSVYDLQVELPGPIVCNLIYTARIVHVCVRAGLCIILYLLLELSETVQYIICRYSCQC